MASTITVAWVEAEWVATEDPGEVRIDLGVRVKGKMQPKAHAAVWLLAGTEADREKAEAWAAKQPEGHVVATWPMDHPDILGAARAQALEDRQARPAHQGPPCRAPER